VRRKAMESEDPKAEIVAKVKRGESLEGAIK